MRTKRGATTTTRTTTMTRTMRTTTITTMIHYIFTNISTCNERNSCPSAPSSNISSAGDFQSIVLWHLLLACRASLVPHPFGGGRCLRVSAVSFRCVFIRLLHLSSVLVASSFSVSSFVFFASSFSASFVFFHHPVGSVRWGVPVQPSSVAAAAAVAAAVVSVPPDVLHISCRSAIA